MKFELWKPKTIFWCFQAIRIEFQWHFYKIKQINGSRSHDLSQHIRSFSKKLVWPHFSSPFSLRSFFIFFPCLELSPHQTSIAPPRTTMRHHASFSTTRNLSLPLCQIVFYLSWVVVIVFFSLSLSLLPLPNQFISPRNFIFSWFGSPI